MSEASKKFKDLRVADLKVELEKRGLQTSGIKAVLAERLRAALADEGIDVEEFVFDKTAAKDTEKGASDEEQAVTGEATSETSTGNEEEKTDQHVETDNVGLGTAAIDDPPVAENGIPVEDPQAEKLENEKDCEEKEAEDDSLNIMVGDEDNLFGEEEKSNNGAPASPPRPENVPAKHPFTSKDTLTLSSRGHRPPSENSSMRVNPDETQSVASHDSTNDHCKDVDEKLEEASAVTANGKNSDNQTPAKEQALPGKNEPDKAKTARPIVATARNLWVSGLAETTRAKDLKELFSKYGKVEGAKVVTNAKHAGARCYGFVTMEKPEDAARCIENLNKRELHGSMILVESATADTGPSRHIASSARPGDKSRSDTGAVSERRKSASKDSSSTRKDDRSRHRGSSSGRGVSSGRGHSSGGRTLSPIRSVTDARRISGGRATGQPAVHRRDDKVLPPAGVLTFHQIKDQRKRELEREEERKRREREKRREEEEERRRKEAIRRQREEEERLRREREELRKEREKLEREKQELMKFERDRQRLEREKLEREKQELERLRRQQMSSRLVVEERRPSKRLADDRDPYFDDRKRSQREDFPSSGSSRGVGDRYDSGRGSRDLSAAGRGPPQPSSRDLMTSSRGIGSTRDTFSGLGHMPGSSRDLPAASFKSSSREISGSSGHLGGSSYMGGSRMGSSGSHMSHSRGVSGGRDRDSGGSREPGRSSGSDYSRSRDDRGLGRTIHASSHDVPSHGSRSNTIGSHASGGSSWSGSAAGGGSSSLSADWVRGSGGSSDRSGGIAGGLPSRALAGMSNLNAMAMGVGVGVNPFGTAIGSNPFAGGSMTGGSLSGSDRYDAYTLKNPVLGTRRY